VTLDTRLCSPVYSLDFYERDAALFPVFDEVEAQIELKFDGRPPDFIPELLSDIPKNRIALSKYTRCLEMIHE